VKAKEVLIAWLGICLPAHRLSIRYLPAQRLPAQCLSRQTPDFGWSSMIDLANAGVEASHATEAGRERDLAHRQTGLIDQLFCKMQTSGLSHGNRRRSQVSQKQAAKMARPNSQTFGEDFHSAILQAAFAD
jgi:hypothetical protein